MIIAVIAKVTPELEKVPKMEQVISAGCAAHGILLAAHALGLGAMWRSGKYAFDPVVRKGLSLDEDDEVVAFIYLALWVVAINRYPSITLLTLWSVGTSNESPPSARHPSSTITAARRFVGRHGRFSAVAE